MRLTPEEDAYIEMHEAVVEIDKVIGGKEEAEKALEVIRRLSHEGV